MKNTMKLLTVGLIFVGVGTILFSCNKDKTNTTENLQNTTTKDGLVYVVDTTNSKIEWKGYKIFKTDNTSHFGTITFKSGEVTVKNNLLESGNFIADVTTLTSIDLKDDEENLNKLNGHLKSADFFDVEKYPEAKFEITKISKTTDGGDYNTLLDGNLTIKDATKPVQFKANVSVDNENVTIATEPKDINREDFGVKFQIPAENGLIKNDVTLQILIKANRKN